MSDNKLKFQIQIVIFTSLIFALKLIAWLITDSVAIFTDAMESTVNIATSFFGLYAVWLASQPRDRNHPYGHGKIEFLAAVIEGTLICFAAFIILYQAISHFQHIQELDSLDLGAYFLGITSIMNIAGSIYWGKKADKVNSPTIQATSKHLRVDAITSLGIILSIILMQWTKWFWLDPIIGILIACYILYEGFLILRKSIGGIMDEANIKLLSSLINHINENRENDWIDLHNLRVIQYGSMLHIDAHITIPYYYTIQEGHELVEKFDKTVNAFSFHQYEFFLHIDPCQPYSCKICSVENCPVRQHPHEKTINWNLENVLENKKHTL